MAAANDTFAIATAQPITWAWLRARKLKEIAAGEVQVGEVAAALRVFADALAAAQQIEGDDTKTTILTEIAIAQAQAGQFSEALSTALQIADGRSKTEALSKIAIAQAQAGQFSESLVTAQQIADWMYKEEALKGVAIAQAQAGEIVAAHDSFDKAIAAAQQIEKNSVGFL